MRLTTYMLPHNNAWGMRVHACTHKPVTRIETPHFGDGENVMADKGWIQHKERNVAGTRFSSGLYRAVNLHSIITA